MFPIYVRGHAFVAASFYDANDSPIKTIQPAAKNSHPLGVVRIAKSRNCAGERHAMRNRTLPDTGV